MSGYDVIAFRAVLIMPHEIVYSYIPPVSRTKFAHLFGYMRRPLIRVGSRDEPFSNAGEAFLASTVTQQGAAIHDVRSPF